MLKFLLGPSKTGNEESEIKRLFNPITAKFALMRVPTDCQIRIFAKINVELAFKEKNEFPPNALVDNTILERS